MPYSATQPQTGSCWTAAAAVTRDRNAALSSTASSDRLAARRGGVRPGSAPTLDPSVRAAARIDQVELELAGDHRLQSRWVAVIDDVA